MAQDRKYGKITVEKEPHTPLPDDEPVFLIRAQDLASVSTIQFYREQAQKAGAPEEFLDSLGEVQNDFMKWQRENVNRVKTPD